MSFKEEAIRRAEQAEYFPAENQRPVNWDLAEEWAQKVQEPEFSWKTEMTADGYTIIGANNAIAAGQHRILGGLVGNNRVPEEAMTRLTNRLPTQPWDGGIGK